MSLQNPVKLVERWHPFALIIFASGCIIAFSSVHTLLWQSSITLLMVISFRILGARIFRVMQSIKYLLWMLPITLFMHLFITSDVVKLYQALRMGGTIWSFFIQPLSFTLRIFTFLYGMGALILLIEVERLLDAVAKLLQPLVKFKIPVNTLLQVLSLGLRFFPILQEEAKQMQELQLSLGTKAPDSLVKRIKFQLNNITPLFIKAMRKAEIVAQVILLRGFKSGQPRTLYSVVPWKIRDSIVAIIGLDVLIWIIVV